VLDHHAASVRVVVANVAGAMIVAEYEVDPHKRKYANHDDAKQRMNLLNRCSNWRIPEPLEEGQSPSECHATMMLILPTQDSDDAAHQSRSLPDASRWLSITTSHLRSKLVFHQRGCEARSRTFENIKVQQI
jgi:hypothetical protein